MLQTLAPLPSRQPSVSRPAPRLYALATLIAVAIGLAGCSRNEPAAAPADAPASAALPTAPAASAGSETAASTAAADIGSAASAVMPTASSSSATPAQPASASTASAASAQPAAADSTFAAQSDRGHSLYNNHCAQCHRPDLTGALGPALTGDAFNAKWAPQGVRAFYDFAHANMPKNAPGSMPDSDMLAIMAYMLKRNGVDAGTAPLTLDRLGALKLPGG